MQDHARTWFIPRSTAGPRRQILEAFLVSTGIVALAEIGEKTQLLALVLAARYKRPLPIVFGILFATLANHALGAFFLVEMGDKTQVATVALAARYVSIATVVAGSTLGMMLANVPAVYVGERLLRRVPAKALRRVAAAIFALLGALALADPKF